MAPHVGNLVSDPSGQTNDEGMAGDKTQSGCNSWETNKGHPLGNPFSEQPSRASENALEAGRHMVGDNTTIHFVPE